MRSASVVARPVSMAADSLFQVPVNLRQMTLGLAGMALYLFCVHSFKLPLASLGLAICLLGIFTSQQQITIPLPVVLLAAFLIWSALTWPLSQYSATVSVALIEYAKNLAILFLAINLCRTRSQLTVFIGLWVLLFGLFPARGTFLNFLAGIGIQGRYAWNFSFENPNDLAAYAILVIALSAFLAMGNHARWIKVGGALSACGLAVLMILTQSRGAFLAAVIGFTLLVVRSRIRTKLIKYVLLASAAVIMISPGAVWDRFSRMKYLLDSETIGQADSSAEQRYILLQVAKVIARDNLTVGVGLGAYSDAHARYADERSEWSFGRGKRDAHNMYMSLAAETGVIGLLLFLTVNLSVLIKATQTERALRAYLPVEAEQLRILRFGLVAYLVAAIFGTLHRISFLYLYLGILWSCSVLSAELLASLPRLSANGTHGDAPLSRHRGATSLRGRSSARVR